MSSDSQVFFFSFGLLHPFEKLVDFCFFFSALLHRSSHPQGGESESKAKPQRFRSFCQLVVKNHVKSPNSPNTKNT